MDDIFATLPSIEVVDESILELHRPSTATEPAANLKLSQHQRFAPPMSDLDVVKAHELAIPREDTAYCIRVWDEWPKSRIEQGAEIQPLVTVDDSTLQHWLTYFILEVRKQNGSEYPPNTLHHLICGIVCLNGRPEIKYPYVTLVRVLMQK